MSKLKKAAGGLVVDVDNETNKIILDFEVFIFLGDPEFPPKCTVDRAKEICRDRTMRMPSQAATRAKVQQDYLRNLPAPLPQDREDKQSIQKNVARRLGDKKNALNKDAQSALDLYDENNPSTVVNWAKAQLNAIAANELFGRWPPKPV